jgi:hypothetical protein
MYLTIFLFLQVTQPFGEEGGSRRMGMMQMMQKMMMERMDMDVQNIIDFLGCLSAQLWLSKPIDTLTSYSSIRYWCFVIYWLSFLSSCLSGGYAFPNPSQMISEIH